MLIAAASNWELLSFGAKGYGDELAWGFLRTVQIAVFAYALGLLIGIAGAFGKIYGTWPTRFLLDVYTTIIRSVPELVMILLLFYAGQDLFNATLTWLGMATMSFNGLIAAIIVLGFVQGAYSTEVLRAAIQAVPPGQVEAAKACGMGWGLIIRRIILPAMFPNAIAGLSNLWLNATKETVLISVVGFTEFALATKQAAGSTKRYMMFYAVNLLVFYILSRFSLRGFATLEKWARRGQAKVA